MCIAKYLMIKLSYLSIKLSYFFLKMSDSFSMLRVKCVHRLQLFRLEFGYRLSMFYIEISMFLLEPKIRARFRLYRRKLSAKWHRK